MDPLSPADPEMRDRLTTSMPQNGAAAASPAYQALDSTASVFSAGTGQGAVPSGFNTTEPNREAYLGLCRITDTGVAIVVLVGAFLMANLQRMPNGFEEFLGMRLTLKNLGLVTVFACLWRLTFTLCGLYDWSRVRQRRQEFVRVVAACTAGAVCALIFPIISKTGAFSVYVVLYFWLGAACATLGLRGLARLVTTAKTTVRDVLIVGSGPLALKMYRKLCERPGSYRVLGFLDSCVPLAEPIAQRMMGGLADLESILVRNPIDEVLIALPIRSRHEEIQQVIRVCERVGVRAKYLADVFDHGSARIRHEESGEFTFRALVMAPEDHRILLKRGIDIGGGVIGLVLSLPILLLVALAIKLSSPGPVLFIQERYGLNRRRFRMYKFRTMVAHAEAAQAALELKNEMSGPVFKIRDDPRITPLGRFLRRTSIDELPQLVNVIRGEMSLVGPRPLPTRDVHRFSEAALMRRFSMRPGLTCLWQVSGRSNIRFDEWIRLDLRYIDEWSLGLDLRILARTLPAVLRGNGAA